MVYNVRLQAPDLKPAALAIAAITGCRMAFPPSNVCRTCSRRPPDKKHLEGQAFTTVSHNTCFRSKDLHYADNYKSVILTVVPESPPTLSCIPRESRAACASLQSPVGRPPLVGNSESGRCLCGERGDVSWEQPLRHVSKCGIRAPQSPGNGPETSDKFVRHDFRFPAAWKSQPIATLRMFSGPGLAGISSRQRHSPAPSATGKFRNSQDPV